MAPRRTPQSPAEKDRRAKYLKMLRNRDQSWSTRASEAIRRYTARKIHRKGSEAPVLARVGMLARLLSIFAVRGASWDELAAFLIEVMDGPATVGREKRRLALTVDGQACRHNDPGSATARALRDPLVRAKLGPGSQQPCRTGGYPVGPASGKRQGKPPTVDAADLREQAREYLKRIGLGKKLVTRADEARALRKGRVELDRVRASLKGFKKPRHGFPDAVRLSLERGHDELARRLTKRWKSAARRGAGSSPHSRPKFHWSIMEDLLGWGYYTSYLELWGERWVESTQPGQGVPSSHDSGGTRRSYADRLYADSKTGGQPAVPSGQLLALAQGEFSTVLSSDPGDIPSDPAESASYDAAKKARNGQDLTLNSVAYLRKFAGEAGDPTGKTLQRACVDWLVSRPDELILHLCGCGSSTSPEWKEGGKFYSFQGCCEPTHLVLGTDLVNKRHYVHHSALRLAAHEAN